MRPNGALEETSTPKQERKIVKNGLKTIDFRVRPPIQAYKTLFDLHIERSTWENRFVSGPERSISIRAVTFSENYSKGEYRDANQCYTTSQRAGR